MPNNPFYVFDDALCKAEGLTKEQIYAAIQEATGSTPTGIDDAFITKIKEGNRSQSLKIWQGSAAEFNQIAEKDANTLYFVTNDPAIEDMIARVDDIAENEDELFTRVGAVEDAITDIMTPISTWTPIMRTNLFSQEAVVGYYAVKNNVAFIEINYDKSEFYAEAYHDQIEIPIKLALSQTSQSFGQIFGFVSYSDPIVGHDTALARLMASATAGHTIIDITSGVGSIEQTIFTFAYPVAE